MADIYLWMWSGFMDLNAKEQEFALKKMEKFFKKYLIIDIPDSHSLMNTNRIDGSKIGDGYVFIQHNDRITYHGYMPTTDEIQFYCRNANLTLKKIIKYETKTKRTRNQFVIAK